jgi:hypothetical protein
LAADWEVGVTLFHSLGIVAYSGVSAAAPGMVLMKPTSIAYSGTSATLGANGQVTFSAVTSLSLNGCFTADFDNYVVSIRTALSSGDELVAARLRASGTDASGSDYTRQTLNADSTTVSASRSTSTSTWGHPTSATARSGTQMFLYGAALAQPTAMRVVTVWGYNSAYIQDVASTHSLSTAYDGITFFRSPQTFTGELAVYGIRS